MATRHSNTLTANRKARLVLWLKDLGQDDARPFRGLAVAATVQLGFQVTTANIQGWWSAVHGPRRACKATRSANDLDAWCDKMEAWTVATETRLASLEERLSAAR